MRNGLAVYRSSRLEVSLTLPRFGGTPIRRTEYLKTHIATLSRYALKVAFGGIRKKVHPEGFETPTLGSEDAFFRTANVRFCSVKNAL